MWVAFGDAVVRAEKITRDQFSPEHRNQVMRLGADGDALLFPDPRWRSVFLGAGEEKAAHLVRDHDARVFVVELIDERSYLNGRLADGVYFATLRHAGAERGAVPGRRFTGLIKAREYVHGYEWSRFQWRPDRRRFVDHLLTAYLRTWFTGRYQEYRVRFGDVHERNVLFEVRPLAARGVLVPARDASGAWRLVKVGVRPVDVR
ncbi:hypothetical protein GCM10009682_26570 [Luedemannella flava]|uniref:Uncharacterized protein n=2 Tax=Luedemannella flava TaxID=349316 RepID=A0ABP4Y872_9ACTN